MPCHEFETRLLATMTRDTRVGSDQQSGASTKRKRKVKCTHALHRRRRKCNDDDVSVPPLPRPVFRRFPDQLWDLYLLPCVPSPCNLPPSNRLSYPSPILLSASKPSDLPQAVLVPGSIAKSYEITLRQTLSICFLYKKFGKIVRLEKASHKL